jgi:hypothetical protein
MSVSPTDKATDMSLTMSLMLVTTAVSSSGLASAMGWLASAMPQRHIKH